MLNPGSALSNLGGCNETLMTTIIIIIIIFVTSKKKNQSKLHIS